MVTVAPSEKPWAAVDVAVTVLPERARVTVAEPVGAASAAVTSLLLVVTALFDSVFCAVVAAAARQVPRQVYTRRPSGCGEVAVAAHEVRRRCAAAPRSTSGPSGESLAPPVAFGVAVQKLEAEVQ